MPAITSRGIKAEKKDAKGLPVPQQNKIINQFR